MSKKIAQLTKVIYYLNTKNEDHNVEIQSLVDAYEDELADVIKDGMGQITDLQARVEENESQLRAQEDLIQRYSETISTQENSLLDAKKLETTLRDTVTALEREKSALQATAKEKEERLSSVEELHRIAHSQKELLASEAKDLGEKHEDELRNEQKRFAEEASLRRVARLLWLSRRRKKDSCSCIERLKQQHSRMLQTYTEENKSATEHLKEAVTALNRQIEDQKQSFETEFQDLKAAHDKELQEMKVDRDEAEGKLLAQMAEQIDTSILKLRKKSMDLSRQLGEAQEKATNLSDRVREQQAVLQESQSKVAGLSAELYNEQEELEALNFANQDQTLKNTELQRNLTNAQVEIAHFESLSRTLKEGHDKFQAESETLRQSLEAAYTYERLKHFLPTSVPHVSTSQIKEFSEKIHVLNREKAGLEVQRVERERAYKQLQDEKMLMEESLRRASLSKRAWQHEMAASLEKQESDLRSFYERDMEEKLNNLRSSFESTILEKEEAIEKCRAEMDSQVSRYESLLKKEKESFDDMKKSLQAKISTAEAQKRELTAKVSENLAALEEKTTEISKLQKSIQQLQNTVKALEVDKADLFQKMVRVDDQIRGELNEKFRIEKQEMKDNWFELGGGENATAIQAHTIVFPPHRPGSDTVKRLETESNDLLEGLRAENTKKEEEWEERRREMQMKIDETEDQLKSTMKAIMDIKEENTKKIAQLIDQHQQSMEMERKNWEFETSARETQLKMEFKITMTNFERKHAMLVEEMETSQKKQLDDIRNQHTKVLMTTKMEAEAVKNAELNRLKALQAEEAERISQAHIAELAETVLSMNVQRMAEIKALNDSHETVLTAKNEEISNLEEQVNTHITSEEDLARRLEEAESTIAALKDEIARKIDEAIQEAQSLALTLNYLHCSAEAEKFLRQREDEILRDHQEDVARINEEHIQEAKRMIKEFEAAQEFFKKQIALHQKQLKDADIKYENREPREVDLKKIADLEEDVRRRKKKAAALAVEFSRGFALFIFLEPNCPTATNVALQRRAYPCPVVRPFPNFRPPSHFLFLLHSAHTRCPTQSLELNNREANFNKIFNKTPLVGVIQPISLSTAKHPPMKKEKSNNRLPPLYSPQSTPPPPPQATIPSISVPRGPPAAP
ncbi:hypothetical protein DFJ73DRAFT_764211 [Zopfochytrium polystomum]|nr:hypothetical protein DFJ73DRAFT_764211 [Zopfochytrium polystomum]